MDNHTYIGQTGKRKNEDLFSGMPENYFENLPMDIKNKIAKTDLNKTPVYRKSPSFGWVLASVTSCFLLLIYFNVFFEENPNNQTEANTYHEFLEEELANSIDINSELEILNVTEVTPQKTDETEAAFLEGIPASELENYLIEEDEDLILYN